MLLLHGRCAVCPQMHTSYLRLPLIVSFVATLDARQLVRASGHGSDVSNGGTNASAPLQSGSGSTAAPVAVSVNEANAPQLADHEISEAAEATAAAAAPDSPTAALLASFRQSFAGVHELLNASSSISTSHLSFDSQQR